MAEWYQCNVCLSDLRSCRHTNLCILSGSGKTSELRRVQSVVVTFAALKPNKGFEVIHGGKYDEQSPQGDE